LKVPSCYMYCHDERFHGFSGTMTEERLFIRIIVNGLMLLIAVRYPRAAVGKEREGHLQLSNVIVSAPSDPESAATDSRRV